MLKEKDFRFPLTTAGIKRHVANAGKAWHSQAVAATSGPDQMTCGFAGHAGRMLMVRVLFDATPGVGESMTIDVLVGGVSILHGGVPIALDLTNIVGKEWLELALDSSLTNVDLGDVLTVNRTYVAGAGALANNVIEAYWA